jgi:cell division septal protein FtsQ
VRVEGTERVSREWVSGELSHLLGQNLLRLSLDAVPRAVSPHPWVEGLEVSKELPRWLRVRVLERQPAALVVGAEGLSFADGEGRLIAPLDGSGPEGVAADLPLVQGEGRWEQEVPLALAVVERVGRIKPDWVRELDRVEVLSEDDLRLVTRAVPYALLVASGDGELGAKIEVLERLLPRLVEEHGEPAAVDLRIPRRIILEPGFEPSSGSGAAVTAHSDER